MGAVMAVRRDADYEVSMDVNRLGTDLRLKP